MSTHLLISMGLGFVDSKQTGLEGIFAQGLPGGSKRPASRLERRAESLASPRDEAWLPGGAWNATPRSLPSLERKIRSRTHA